MGLELRVIISANINSTIAVILSPNLSLYDLQKPRYGLLIFAISRDEIGDFRIFRSYLELWQWVEMILHPLIDQKPSRNLAHLVNAYKTFWAPRLYRYLQSAQLTMVVFQYILL